MTGVRISSGLPHTKVFDAFENKCPYVIVTFFEENAFNVFKNKKDNFALRNRVLLWEWHSHNDAKAPGSLGRGLSYLKKYLLKSIDKENPVSKGLRTLALGWLFNKRAFSVSGKFKELLADLKKTKHNSNQKEQQITLDGEKLHEYRYYFLEFMPLKI